MNGTDMLRGQQAGRFNSSSGPMIAKFSAGVSLSAAAAPHGYVQLAFSYGSESRTSVNVMRGFVQEHPRSHMLTISLAPVLQFRTVAIRDVACCRQCSCMRRLSDSRCAWQA
jgi:hypothetical protein